MTISRDLAHWRQLPVLSVAEAAELAGISARSMEQHLPQLEVRLIGRQRRITVESFRRWIGEDVPTPEPAKALTVEAMREARAWRKRGAA